VASGGGTVDPVTAVLTNSQGIAVVSSWTLGNVAGPNSLTATATGLTGSPVTFTATGEIGPASPFTSTLTATPTSIVANGISASTIVLQLRDAAGNALPDKSNTGITSFFFFTTAGTLSSPTNNSDGTFQWTLTSVTPGTATVTVELNGILVTDDATVEFTDGSSVQTIYISNAPDVVNKSVGGNFGTQSIFLAPGADAPGCGTNVQPCATLSYIFGTLTANDIVYVNGTIIESAYYDLTAGMFGVSIQGLGTTDPDDPNFAHIVFPDPPSGTTSAIDIPVGADDVSLQNIRLSFAGNSGFGNGTLVSADADDVVFDNGCSRARRRPTRPSAMLCSTEAPRTAG
jgi:hypothetical protein